jgi:hypothetical protein
MKEAAMSQARVVVPEPTGPPFASALEGMRTVVSGGAVAAEKQQLLKTRSDALSPSLALVSPDLQTVLLSAFQGGTAPYALRGGGIGRPGVTRSR